VRTYTDDDLREYATIFELVHADAVDDQDSYHVTHAGQLISSGAGLFNMFPSRLAELLLQAIETGYGHALRDVRAGDVPDLGQLE
jgi:hypothetical protein